MSQLGGHTVLILYSNTTATLIHLPNSSSIAMMISTWSRLSSPRSFTKWESRVNCKETMQKLWEGNNQPTTQPLTQRNKWAKTVNQVWKEGHERSGMDKQSRYSTASSLLGALLKILWIMALGLLHGYCEVANCVNLTSRDLINGPSKTNSRANKTNNRS